MCQLPSKGMLSKDVSWIHSLAMDIQWKDILMQLFGRHLAKLKYITVYARDEVNGICQSILSAFYNCIHYFRPILRVKISFFPFGLLLLLPLVNTYIYYYRHKCGAMHFEIEYTLHVVNIHSGSFDENVINKASAEQLLTARHDSMHQQRNERSEKLNEMNQFVRMLCCQRDALASFFWFPWPFGI